MSAPAAVATFEQFARLRRCPACRAIIAPGETLCPGCERVLLAPHSDEWPRELRRHLQVLLVERHTPRAFGFRDDRHQLTDAGWRHLLLTNYRGTILGQGASRRVVPWSAVADDVYLDAVAAAQLWAASLTEISP